VKDVSGLAGEASVILKGMAWRAFTNRLVLYFVILALMAANIGVIYAYWGPKKKETPPPAPTPYPGPF
jgi:hypothetical protein